MLCCFCDIYLSQVGTYRPTCQQVAPIKLTVLRSGSAAEQAVDLKDRLAYCFRCKTNNALGQ